MSHSTLTARVALDQTDDAIRTLHARARRDRAASNALGVLLARGANVRLARTVAEHGPLTERDAAETGVMIFAAVDHDCDGSSTAFYRLPSSTPVAIGEPMPDELWTRLFDGSHYFGPSDLFRVPAHLAARARAHAETWHGDAPHWHRHGRYDHMSVKGSWS